MYSPADATHAPAGWLYSDNRWHKIGGGFMDRDFFTQVTRLTTSAASHLSKVINFIAGHSYKIEWGYDAGPNNSSGNNAVTSSLFIGGNPVPNTQLINYFRGEHMPDNSMLISPSFSIHWNAVAPNVGSRLVEIKFNDSQNDARLRMGTLFIEDLG